MKFHVTITRNEDGEVLRDTDTNAYVAVIDIGDQIGIAHGLTTDTDTVCNIAECLLAEYYTLIELMPKKSRKFLSKKITKNAKQSLKKKTR